MAMKRILDLLTPIHRLMEQWLKEKEQKEKQRSTKHTYKTKDRVTQTPLKTGGELRCSGRVTGVKKSAGLRPAICGFGPNIF
jgi:hypothetical protein